MRLPTRPNLKTGSPSSPNSPSERVLAARRRRRQRAIDSHPKFESMRDSSAERFNKIILKSKEPTSRNYVSDDEVVAINAESKGPQEHKVKRAKRPIHRSKNSLICLLRRACRRVNQVLGRELQAQAPELQQNNNSLATVLSKLNISPQQPTALRPVSSLSIRPLKETDSPISVLHRFQSVKRAGVEIFKIQNLSILSLHRSPHLNKDNTIRDCSLLAAMDYRGKDAFMALTSAELLGMLDAKIGDIERIKVYQGPSNTPEPEPQEPIDTIDFNEEAAFATDEDRKDLIRHLGRSKSGFQILTRFNTGEPTSTYIDPINQSDYYEMPLIYPEDEELDDNSEDLNDDAANHLKLPKSFPVGQSLILFLRGKGLDFNQISARVAHLDRNFLWEHGTRWYRDVRIPEYWYFTDEIADEVMELAQSEPEAWEPEGAKDFRGKVIPEAYKVMKRRMRESTTKRLVYKAIENHFWYRLKSGKLPHLEIRI